MATEALRAPGLLDGATPITSTPPISDIPFYLKRKTLKAIRFEEGSVPEQLWADRATIVEKRIQAIIASQSEIIKTVTMNPAPDTQGPDLTIGFVENLPVKTAYIEVKSSSIGIGDYKQKIRDKLPIGERNETGVRKWLTEHGIILINGTEHKTPKEILRDSFYPQLERIQQKALREQNPEPSGQMTFLFKNPEKTLEPSGQMTLSLSESGQIIEAPGQIQIFPELA